MSGHKHGKGFTLVELLIVIAVITILATLLLPVLKRAIESARAVHCMNNNKEIYFGFVSYSEDNKGKMPVYNQGMGNVTINGITRNYAWVPWISKIHLGQYVGNNAACSSAFPDQRPTTKLLLCPSYNLKESNYYTRTGLGYNSKTYNQFSRNGRTKLNLFFKPSMTLIMVDTGRQWYFENLQLGYDDTKAPAYRHNDMANILFADGHVGNSENVYGDKLAKNLFWKADASQ